MPSSRSLLAQTEAITSYFKDVTASVGIDFVHVAAPSGEFHLPEIIGPGAALFDYDGDGDLDLYLIQAGGPVVSDTLRQTNQLYRNDLQDGAPRFVNVTKQAGVGDAGYGMGVATGDIDNDGDVDFYVTNFGANALYVNQGNGRFLETGAAAGVAHAGWGASAAFADYDGDGLLDLFVTHYVANPVTGNRSCKNPIDRADYCSPTVFTPTADTLYRNVDGKRFADVTVAAGLAEAKAAGLGVLAADFDGDERIDFFVANDQSANFLWRNEGDGVFRESGLVSGSAYNAHGMAEASMGVTASDFDGDGDVDLFMTHLKTQTNTLYTNDGRGGFTDSTDRARLGSASLVFTGFGARWFDADNDADLDLFVANGAVVTEPSRISASDFPYEQRNQLFILEAAGTYQEWRGASDDALAATSTSRGAAFGDLDNDGDIDIVVANANAAPQILVNAHDVSSDWFGLDVRLANGRTALGARVALLQKGRAPLWRRVARDGSYLSANDPRAHFGLGAGNDESLRVGVVWPDGQREQWADVRPGRYLRLMQGEGEPWDSDAS
ncbi:MAG: CRTAC1 family protein [Gammaproteobacteria bacterium]